MRRAALSLLTGTLLLGCASAQVETGRSYAGDQALPRPDVVLVYDFSLSSSIISLDSAPGVEPGRAQQAEAYSEEQLKLGRNVASTLAKQLVENLRALGLPAERAYAPPLSGRHTLMVTGEFVEIDSGTKDTSVRTRTRVYQVAATGPRLLEEFETAASGSKKPRTAEQISQRIGTLASRQGWISQSTGN